MTMNKKAARSGANTTNGNGYDRLRQADRPKTHSITEVKQEQDRPIGIIETYLFTLDAVGEDVAIPSRRAKAALGYADIRNFRSALEGERQGGAVICGSSRGIYLPHPGARVNSELEQHIRTTQARIGSMSSRLNAIRRELHRRRHADQIQIAEGGVGNA